MLAKDHSPYRNKALEKTVEGRDAARKELNARIEQVVELTANLRGLRERQGAMLHKMDRLEAGLDKAHETAIDKALEIVRGEKDAWNEPSNIAYQVCENIAEGIRALKTP